MTTRRNKLIKRVEKADRTPSYVLLKERILACKGEAYI